LLADARFQRARRHKLAIRAVVKASGEDLSKIWLPTEFRLLPLPNVEAEASFLEEWTLEDWMSANTDEALDRAEARGDQDQHALEKILRRKATEENAKRELNAEIAAAKKKPSKASLKRGLNDNTQEERQAVKKAEQKSKSATSKSKMASIKKKSSESVEVDKKARELAAAASAADSAMDHYHDKGKR
jgi:hypothetical protein